METAELYKRFLECGKVTTDSRYCQPGSMFIALKGEHFNGNTFADQAIKQGCRYAIIDEAQYLGPQTILVDNCLKALQDLACYHRKQLGTPIIGITGTNGKTTTKELIAAVLNKKYHILYTQGNLNNHIGVPLTLLQLTPQHEFAVIEMGANHPGEISTLAHIAAPDYGLITNIGKAHLEGFGSFEGIIRTKGELYDYLRQKRDSTIFIQDENPYLNPIAYGLNCIRYGTGKHCFVQGQQVGSSPFLQFEWKVDGKIFHITTHLIGTYNFDNALAAVAVGHYFHVKAEDICTALTEYTPQNNRSQLKKTNHNILIVDAYNANPTSMKAAIDNFREMTAPHKMVILGAMKELGINSNEEHHHIINLLTDCHFERTILVGAEFTQISEKFEYYPTTSALINMLEQQSIKGYHILIKGSNSMKLNQLTKYL